jgi:hypothetical protein
MEAIYDVLMEDDLFLFPFTLESKRLTLLFFLFLFYYYYFVSNMILHLGTGRMIQNYEKRKKNIQRKKKMSLLLSSTFDVLIIPLHI